MLKGFSVFFRFYLFWILFFFLDRALFLVYFSEKLTGSSFPDVLRIFVYGLWMDASAAAYVSALPLLGVLVGWLLPKTRLSATWTRNYVLVLLLVFGVLTIANFNIYREWGTRINFKALDFLFTSPTEAFASSASSPILQSWMIFFVFIGAVWLLSRKIIAYRSPEIHGIAARVVTAVVLLASSILFIRGGWQLSPMNESMVYFSDRTFLNHAAINTEWALIRDIIKNKYSTENPYGYFPEKTARKLVKELYLEKPGETPDLLTIPRPNVVLVIMESYTASLMPALGGEKNGSPNLEQLAGDGLLFTNAYASGDRTDKGLIAILSGFPSQAIRSIIGFNSKQEKLPSIFREMADNGYATSFYYGGETEFFNVKSYMLSHGCGKIIDIHNFERRNMNSKWGAYDEFVFDKQLSDFSKQRQPFFSTVLTLTNHEPFEIPGRPKFPGDRVADKFRSTAAYADSCVGAFMTKAKKQPWYTNTLFIFIADHGHHLPLERYDIYDPHRFHIPILIAGGALKNEWRGKKITKITSQTDLPAILFHQLGIDAGKFNWSKNTLNTGVPAFAFYDWDNGFGVMTPQQTLSFDNIGRNVSYRKHLDRPETDSLLIRSGQACMQEVFRQYLEY